MKTPARTIVCTVGTSIANRCPSLKSYYERTSSWDEDVESLKSEIRDRLMENYGSGNNRYEASAEINSLHHLQCGEQDTVILFVSDTGEGKACLHVLKETLEELFNPHQIRADRIPGLQARDGELLKKKGIPGLIRSVTPILQDPQTRYGGGVVLNVTGGFKGVVPFMTVLGMLYRAQVVYIFEFSNDLISLPPIPITIDLEVFERARPALEWAQNVAVFPPPQFYKLVEGYESSEEDLFAGFLEIESGREATLSSLATALIEEEKSKADHIMVSKKARAFLDSMDISKRVHMEALATRLASPIHRRNHRKAFHGTDLEVYGKSGFAARFSGFTENSIFHLCLAEWTDNHDNYEREFARHNRQNFGGQDEFEELESPVSEISNHSEIDQPSESWSDLRQERDFLRHELAQLRKRCP